MLLTAALLAVLLAALSAVPARLAAAGWPVRAPTVALLLWQAIGLAAGLLVLEIVMTLALAPHGRTHEDAVRRLVAGAAPLSPWSLLAAALAVAVLLRLLGVLATSTARTLTARRAHRRMVDLVATSNPLLRGASVVDHTVPVAYCLPGLRSRVVLSHGALCRLSDAEVAAVLAHERAHLVQRHDLVVLPFVALDATFPRLTPVRTAGAEVALLVEMLADDRAVREHDRGVLARALYKVGAVEIPAGGLGVAGQPASSGVLVRAGRLLDPPQPLGRFSTATAALATAAVFLLPLAGLVLPLLS